MLQYKRYPNLDFTWLIASKEFTLSEYFSGMEKYTREGLTKYELFDLRASFKPFKRQDIDAIVKTSVQDVDKRPPDGLSAILVDKAWKYGLIRMYSAMEELKRIPATTRAFYDLTKALNWLGPEIKELVEETGEPDF